MNYATSSKRIPRFRRHVITTSIISPEMLAKTSFDLERRIAVDVETCKWSRTRCCFIVWCHYDHWWTVAFLINVVTQITNSMLRWIHLPAKEPYGSVYGSVKNKYGAEIVSTHTMGHEGIRKWRNEKGNTICNKRSKLWCGDGRQNLHNREERM